MPPFPALFGNARPDPLPVDPDNGVAPAPLSFWLSPRIALLGLAIAVAAATIVAYGMARHWVKDSVERELSGAAHLKTEQIERWFEERRMDVHVVIAAPMFLRGLRKWLDGERDPDLAAQLAEHLGPTSGAARFGYFCLRSARDGAPLLPSQCDADSPQLREIAMAAGRDHEPKLEDFHRSKDDDISGPTLGMLVPVDLKGGRHPEVVAHVSLDPAQSLFPTLQRWPGASPSAEVLLVRRDGGEVLYLNTLRYRDALPLTLQRPLSHKELLASQAVTGSVGMVHGVDYRGVASVGYIMPVGGTPWFLVAKMDQSDADAWLDRLSFAVLSALALALLVGFRWWVERQRYVTRLHEYELAQAVLAERMDYLSRHTHDCILLVDLAGRILDASDQCHRLYGCSVEEMQSLDGTQLLRAAQPDGDLAALWARLSEQGDLVLLAEHRCKDASTVPVEVSMRAFKVAQKPCIQAIVRDITERRAMEQERERQSAHLAELSHRLISVQEDERRRLSAELHDRTSPNLAALDINLRSLARRLPAGANGEAAMLLDDASALLADTAESIREVCADLRPPVLDHAGLLPALQSYAHQFSSRTALAVKLDCPERPMRFASEVESTLFRIAQEALTNCAKHARATRVSIGIQLRDDEVTMDIVDDGIGFTPDAAISPAAASGHGLLSMRERAQFAGGSLKIDARPGHGTRVTVSLPVAFAPGRPPERKRNAIVHPARAQRVNGLTVDTDIAG